MPAVALVVLLHGVLSGGLPAAAEGPPTPAPPSVPEAALADAARDFDALRLEEAAVRLERLVADPDTPAPTRARALLLLGLTRAGLVDEAGAGDAFARALTLDPALDVPPETSPKVRALFERTRAALPRAPLPSSPPKPPAPPPTAAPPAAAPPAAAPADDDVVLATGTGAALLGAAAAAGVAVALADLSLGTPVAGRTRAEHDLIRTLGLGSLVGSVTLGLAGAAGLITAALWSLDDSGGAP